MRERWLGAGSTGLVLCDSWLRCRVWPLTTGGIFPVLTGCLREADRAGRGGGSISVFFGDGGLLAGGCTGCTGDRLPVSLRGEGGANEGAELLDAEVTDLIAGILSALGRMML